MKYPLHRSIHLVVLALLLAIGGAGCSRNLNEPIAQFQKTSDEATSAMATYYAQLNDFERDLYLKEKLYSNDQINELENNKPTPLVGETFDPKSVQARIALVKQVAVYGQRLAELAGSTAPSQFETNVHTLSENLFRLKNTFASLGKTNRDTEAKDYVGPIGQIIGVVGRRLLEKKRDRKLTEAIAQGKEPVDQILEFVERDLDKYVGSTRLTGIHQSFTTILLHYETRRLDTAKPMGKAEKEELIAAIDEAARRYTIARATRPGSIAKSLQNAHYSMVRYVDRSPDFWRGDLKEPAAFAAKLRDATDPVSQYLKEKRFSTETKELLTAYTYKPGSSGPVVLPPEKLRQALTTELNKVVNGNSIYNATLFPEEVELPDGTKEKKLSEEIVKLIQKNPQGQELKHLNRLLLESAYPEEIAAVPESQKQSIGEMISSLESLQEDAETIIKAIRAFGDVRKEGDES